jgi:signal transduction histidine kinase
MKALRNIKKVFGPYPYNPVFIFLISFIYFFTRFGPTLTELAPGLHRQWVALVILFFSAVPSAVVALVAWCYQRFRFWNSQNFLWYFLEIISLTVVLRIARVVEMKIPLAEKYVSNKRDLINADIYIYFYGFVAVLLLNAFLSFAERETIGQLNLAKKLVASLSAERRELVVANEEGRSQISSFLHDRVQSDLMLISMELKSLKNQLPEASKESMDRTISQLESIRGVDLRKLIEVLNPDLNRNSLDEAFDVLAQQYKNSFKTHISVQPLDKGMDQITQIELGLYRIVEQHLLNCLMHAQCTNVWIELTHDTRAIRLSIRDDGAGGAKSEMSPGYGTALINSWVDVLGGTLEVSTEKDSGYVLNLEISLNNGTN